jgi:parallel beta-helix repeat protein
MISINFIRINRVSETKDLKLSITSNPIFIDDNDPSHNWSVAKAAGKCTGEGTYSNPYVIEDLEINGAGRGVDCIRIENSSAFFRIENCTAHSSDPIPGYHSGILLINVNNSEIIDNYCYSHWSTGIRLENSHNNSITGNTLSDCGAGVNLINSKFNIISGNTMGTPDFNGVGIRLTNSHDNTISGNSIIDSFYSGISLTNSNNNTFSGNTANDNSAHGILLAFSNDNTFSGNTANGNGGSGLYLQQNCNNNTFSGNTCNSNDEDGIFIDLNCYDNTISGNTVNYNDGGGIYLYNCERNNVSGNTASYNTNDGINLEDSDDNVIMGNDLDNNDDGVHLEGSDDNIITGNDLNNNDLGIYLENSERIEISGNTIDQFALQLVGNLQMLSSHDIDNTNLVSGKSIYYYANEVNLGTSDFTNAGQVILVNCNDSSVSNLDIAFCPIGIALYYCYNNTVSGNTANDNTLYGILLYESSYNTISGNTVLRNGECIKEVNCEGNVFSDNGDCTPDGDGDGPPGIPGFVLYVLIGILTVALISVGIFIILKRRKIK